MFQELEAIRAADGNAAVLERLASTLREQKDYHKLFDVLLMQHRLESGLGLIQPTRFEDVPSEQQDAFEEAYVAAAREVGRLFLAADDVPQAWLYLRTIREPEPVRQALEALQPPYEPGERTERLIQVALFDGAHPVKGLELLLRTHGTCNTITSFDQSASQMDADSRRRGAALLVRELYGDLTNTIRRIIEERDGTRPAEQSLRQMIEGRDWLFEGGGYHIDFSHLHSVVRFARLLDAADPELQKAIELAEYGMRLDPQFQYAGDPPFESFYAAHREYLRAIANEDRDGALGYFREQLASASEDSRQLVAYALVDLLRRCNRLDEAVEIAAEHLRSVDPASGFSFAELCKQAGRMDLLRDAARQTGDVVMYAAALLQGEQPREAVSGGKR